MEVKIKKLQDDAVIPAYAKEGDAGLDLTIVGWNVGPNNTYIEYRTGLSVEIPEGFVGLIFPRSSISKKDLYLCNAVGVIDSKYRGEILCRFKDNKRDYITSDTKLYTVGDRCAQLIIIPYPQIEFVEGDLDETERGTGGFGSSDT